MKNYIQVISKYYKENSKIINALLIAFIVLIGFFLRSYNPNWDEGALLHPDERFMLMTTNDISAPDNLEEYFDVENSKLSPANNGKGNFIYGTFPLFLNKLVSETTELNSFRELAELGRLLSAIFDTGTLILIFFITKELFNRSKVALLASGMYAFSVFGIQQSHFFTVDNFYLFWIVFTIFLIIKFIKSKDNAILFSCLASITFALALASKLSAVLLILYIFLAYLYKFLAESSIKVSREKIVIGKLKIKIIIMFILSLLTTAFVFRLFQPYIFAQSTWFDWSLSQEFMRGFNFQRDAVSGLVIFPPQYQWFNTVAFLHPLYNIAIWYIGLPTSILFIFGLFFLFTNKLNTVKKYFTKENYVHILNLIWILTSFIYFGKNFVKAGRYLISISPFIYIYGAFGLYILFKFKNIWLKIVASMILFFHISFGLSYFNIYTEDVSRISASKWIYKNIPEGSTILIEHWDDGLPVSLEGIGLYSQYDSIQNEVYNTDNESKLDVMYDNIANSDFIVISSPRARWTIGRLPEEFPYMVNYYKALDNGSLGINLVKKTTTYPNIYGVDINNSPAEESFWIYDHPPVWIYEVNELVSREEFKKILTK